MSQNSNQRLRQYQKQEIYDLSYTVNNSADRMKKCTAIKKLKDFVELGLPNVAEEMVKSGLIPILINCMQQRNDEEIQNGGVAIISYLTSANKAYKEQMIQLGAVPPLLQIIESSSEVNGNVAIHILSRLVSVNSETKGLLLSHGYIDKIINMIKPDARTALLEDISCTLAHLCCKDPIAPPMPVSVVQTILTALNKLMIGTNVKTLWYTIATAHCVLQADHRHLVMANEELIQNLLPMLKHSNDQILKMVLKILFNITSGPGIHSGILLQFNLLSYVPTVIMHESIGLRQFMCVVVTTIIIHHNDYLQKIIEANLMPLVLINVGRGDWSAIYLIYISIKTATQIQLGLLLSSGILPALFGCLDLEDGRKVLNVLKGLFHMLLKIRQLDFPILAISVMNFGVIAKLQALGHFPDISVQIVSNQLLACLENALSNNSF